MTRHSHLDFQSALDGRTKARIAARAVIRPDDLGLLGRVLETHCRTYGIRSEEGRGSVAQSLMAHFISGVADRRDLLAILEREDRPLPEYAGRRD